MDDVEKAYIDSYIRAAEKGEIPKSRKMASMRPLMVTFVIFAIIVIVLMVWFTFNGYGIKSYARDPRTGKPVQYTFEAYIPEFDYSPYTGNPALMNPVYEYFGIKWCAVNKDEEICKDIVTSNQRSEEVFRKTNRKRTV